MKHKILMTLALLITAVGGAWATDVITVTWSSGDTYENNNSKDGVTLSGENVRYDGEEWQLAFYEGKGTFTTELGNFTKIEINGGYIYGFSGEGWSGRTWTGNAAAVPFNGFITDDFGEDPWTITFTIEPASSPSGPEVAWNAATKTGTFEMPAYDVEIAPIYAPKAKWATEGDAVLAPTAIEGVIAGTEDAIVKAGTVVEGQGTAMYFATTDAEMTAEKAAKADGWLSTLPTAAGYDGATTVYVWYYIKGADTPDGQEATAENTFNDLEICATPLKVEVLSNKFDIQFNAANANTIEAGKATVKVGETAAEVKEGKLTGVKMGSKVTITAKDGYKFRKAEGKEGIVALMTLNVGGDCPGTITYAEGETWGQAIQNHPTENTGWTIGSSGSILYNYYGVWLGNDRVKQGDAITPGLGYYTE